MSVDGRIGASISGAIKIGLGIGDSILEQYGIKKILKLGAER
jgi:hypothetical protein